MKILLLKILVFPLKKKTEPEPDSHHVITEPLDLNKESAKAVKFNKEIEVIPFVDTLIEGVSNANLVENKESVKIDKHPVTEEQPQLGVKTGDMGKVKVRGTEEEIIMVELEPYYQPGDLCDKPDPGINMIGEITQSRDDVLEIFEDSEIREVLRKNTNEPIFKVGKTIGRHDGIYIEGSINGKLSIFTVDTGATRTVISRNTYLSLPEERRPPLKPSSSLIGADGNPLREMGTAVFEVKLGTSCLNMKLVVAHIADQALLGLDILMMGDEGPAEIRLADRVLNWNAETIPFNCSGDLNRVRNVVAADDTIVPGCSELILDAYIEKRDLDSWFSNREFFIEPSPSFMEKSSLIVATCLVDMTNSVTGKVRIMNPLGTEVEIHQDTVIGTALLNEYQVIPLMNIADEVQSEDLGYSKVRRLPLNSDQIHRKVEVVSDVQKVRPEPKPDIEQKPYNPNPSVPPHLADIFEKIKIGRSETEITQIAELFNDFGDVFSKSEDDIGLTNLVEHSIDTGDARPIKQPPRRVPLAFADKEREMIQQMERQGIIRKSTSPWGSPLCLVLKKSTDDTIKVRPTVDFRAVNKLCQDDAFPLPRIQDCLDSMSGATLFTCVDLLSGYHQVPVREVDIPKTAMVTKYGLYEFTRMPMGLKSSAQTFQRLMELVLRGLQWSILLIYLDDVIVFSRTFEGHMERLRLVLQRIKEAGLKLKPSKCQFLQTEVKFLGHVVSGEGVKPNPDNLMKVKLWSSPKTVTQIKQFLGLASYYRRFIQNFSDIASPMIQLTKKGEDFVWSDKCEKSFQKLKELLLTAPIVAYPNDEDEYILDTDASDIQIGAVLSQVQNGQEKVIAYGSRTLNKAERNYCVTDKELLSLRYFVEYYRQYLLGRKFVLRTDHQPLIWLFSLKEPKGRIARWIEILSTYDFSIIHRPGKKHCNADSLSRFPQEKCLCDDVDTMEQLKCGPCKKCVKRAHDMESSLLTEDAKSAVRAVTRSQVNNLEKNYCTVWKEKYIPIKLSQLQYADVDIRPILEGLKKDEKPVGLTTVSPAIRYYCNIWSSLTLVNNVVYKKFYFCNGSVEHLQLLVPSCLRQEVLKLAHNSVLSGHFGRKKTFEKVRREFYWFGMKEDIDVFVARCDLCAQNKFPNKKPRAPLGSISTGAPLDRISIDVVGPLPRTVQNNRYFLTVTDHFTKWTEVYPVPDQTAETCAHKILDEFVSRFGCPASIHSDQGTSFESAIFRELCQILEIRKTRTSARNPKGNGQCERIHRTVLQMIRAYLKNEQSEWDKHLGCLLAAYRACVNESTGMTPNMMMFGHEVKTPLNLIFGYGQSKEVFQSCGEYVSQIRDRIHLAHEVCRRFMLKTAKRRKDNYDIKSSLIPYSAGDPVWFLNEQRREGVCQKLQPIYIGPCVILKKLNDLNYCIQQTKDGPVKVVNHDKLKPYLGNQYPDWAKKALRNYRRKDGSSKQ